MCASSTTLGETIDNVVKVLQCPEQTGERKAKVSWGEINLLITVFKKQHPNTHKTHPNTKTERDWLCEGEM